MKNAIKIICVLIGLCTLPGCATMWMARIYNNSGEDKVLSADIKRLDWRKDTCVEFFYPNSTMSFGVWSPGKAWKYKENLPPDNFVSEIGTKRTMFLQLQSDGTIYVVPPGTVFPVNRIPAQPAGWPVKPFTSKENH